ncbi:kinase-like domain-containing protein [Xylaria sp. FL1777]|nr:kinase-like domain-containing protein [Xylaria sp. FL1777]
MSFLDELKRRIRRAKQQSQSLPHQWFIPTGDIDKILTPDDIAKALTDPAFEVSLPLQESASRIIADGGKVIFSLLLELDICPFLGSFIQENILDTALPVDKSRVEPILGDDAQSFISAQWSFLPYTLESYPYHRRLRSEEVVPYTYMSEIGGGKCSKVYKVKIHPTHNHLVTEESDRDCYFVCKKLETAGPGGQAAEAELLFYLRALKHENIVELLTSYSQNNVPHLIFHPADSDLRQLLRQDRRPPALEDDHCIIKALHGLCSGLRHLHQYHLAPTAHSKTEALSMNGCHHDLKPNNVLVQGSRFILADFGLSRLKDLSEDSKTPWQNAAFDYGAPECRDPTTFKVGRVGRASDVWSLGCIILEVSVYMRYGAEGVEEFRRSRQFQGEMAETFAFHNDRTASPAVDSCIERLSNCQSIELSNMATLLRRMISLQIHVRPSMDIVTTQMQGFATRAALEKVLQLAGVYIDGARGRNAESNVILLTQLQLEVHRLQSWAGALGLAVEGDLDLQQDGPVISSFQEVMDLLYHTISGLEQHIATDEEAPDNSTDYWLGNQNSSVSLLHQLNNRLHYLLSPSEKSGADRLFMALATYTENTETLLNISRGLSSQMPPQYGDVGVVAAMRYIALLESKDIDAATADSVRIDPVLVSEDPHKEDPTTRPQTYWYHNSLESAQKVHVERIRYGKSWTKQVDPEDSKKVGEAIYKRAQRLAAMLRATRAPDSFRSFRCIGVYHRAEEKHLGLTFEVPNQDEHLVRLHKLLRWRKGGADSIPPADVDEKYCLANALSSSLHRIHLSGWLHKDLNPMNIVFSHPNQNAWKNVDYSRPYIVGFDHSREHNPEEYTEGPDESMALGYHHPAYRNGLSRFQKSFDIFSLGLVLLSIGLWTPIVEEMRERYPETSSNELARKYIELCETKLPKSTSRRYCDAVKACLELALSDTIEETEVISAFRTKVIDKIAKLSP